MGGWVMSYTEFWCTVIFYMFRIMLFIRIVYNRFLFYTDEL